MLANIFLLLLDCFLTEMEQYSAVARFNRVIGVWDENRRQCIMQFSVDGLQCVIIYQHSSTSLVLKWSMSTVGCDVVIKPTLVF